MIPTVDIRSDVAVYVQIENQIQFAIASGRLQPGEQLPSVRELSERLQVNPNTVAKAYRDLEVMGLLYTRRGMGVFVDKEVEGKPSEDIRKRIIGRLFNAIAEAKAAGMTRKEMMGVFDASMSSNADPYGDTPPSLLALAKLQKRRAKARKS